MIRLTRLTVQGFRGFTGLQTFEFPSPATILFGENHCGKSSTLNAIEWCLFGAECVGTKTNIRERIGWVIANQHLARAEVMVELRLTGPDGEFVVRRRLHQPPKKRTPVEDLELEGPDGELASGPGTKQLLAKWLNSTFRDFGTMVYQHQESIRGIVTHEPKERNDAIDRLLGLSDYRNLLSGIAGANPKGRQKNCDEKVNAFEMRVGVAVGLLRNQLEQSFRDAEKAGVPRSRVNEPTALQIAKQVVQGLQTFTKEIGLAASLPAVPRAWQDLQTFEEAVKECIQTLRRSLPDQEEQTKLYGRQTEIKNRLDDYDDLQTRQGDIERQFRELNKQHGGQKRVGECIAEVDKNLEQFKNQQTEISGRQAVIVEAIIYLASSEPELASRCPVCERDSKDLLPTLRNKLQATIKDKLDEIGLEIAKLSGQRGGLAKVSEDYQKLEKRLKPLVGQEKPDLDTKVAKLLKRDISREDDPVALLKREQEFIGRRLEQLKSLIEERQKPLTQSEGELGKLRCVHEVLHKTDQQRIIEQVKESPAKKELDQERDRLAVFVNDVEAIKQPVAAASNSEADEKLKAADRAIDDYFRRLARNPAVEQIILERKEDAQKGLNVYKITDQSGQDLTPLLSQGDLNALAMAIFLGLASAGGTTAPLGFVMLDDPSQSMGAEHKENLASVLDEVCHNRHIVLATIDGEFYACLNKGLTRAKSVYMFDGWTPSAGPSVRLQ